MTHEITKNNPFCVMGLFIGDVQAQEMACADRKDVITFLLHKHKEALIARGFTPDAALVEVFVSPSKTFTITVTFPINNLTCLLAIGSAWERDLVDGVKVGKWP